MTSPYQLDPSPSARGAQGEVYFGTRRSDGLAIAVKVAAKGRSASAALEQEIAVLQTLDQARIGGVVPCLDTLEHEGRPALVMPRYPSHLGLWLNQAVQKPGPRTLVQALRYCSSIAYTLGRVHATPWQGGTLVHRDIKPENVFLDEHGTPYVGDFGGAMAIGGLARVELGLFGTPMWAPLDQILPGQAIPDPTWDTYALCVFLYAALTGARPAYQSDPRTLLTPAGRDLWDVARKAVEGPESERGEWARHFARMRTGAKAGDLVDVTGHGALVDADRIALDTGVKRLGTLSGLPRKAQRSVARQLWTLMSRGLSPVSHPSPPNRFRDGLELGELLDELLEDARPPRRAPASEAAIAEPRREITSPDIDLGSGRSRDERPSTTLSTGPSALLLAGLATVALGICAAGVWLWRAPILEALDGLQPHPDRIAFSDGVTPAFSLDRLEVSGARWQGCVTAGPCEARDTPPPHPVVGLDATEAEAFCAWAGGRLPTEAEWERALGPGPMPWGEDTPTCRRAVALGCGDGVLPVGSARAGRSAEGVEDLAGNAWEWVQSPEGPVLRGGGARSPVSELGRAGRRTVPEGGRDPLAGVRCAYPQSG